VSKELGGDTTGTADSNWPKGYSMLDDVMFSTKYWGRGRRGCRGLASKLDVAQKLAGLRSACGRW